MIKQGLALFDFDGTITTKDSLFEFLKFYKGKYQFYFGMLILSPFLFFHLYLTRNRSKAKGIVLNYFFGGIELLDFEEVCHEFVNKRLPQILRKEAIEKIKKHLSDNDRVVVVSASPENWIIKWCDSIKIECIATKLQIKKGCITGYLSSPNCNGEEKPRRISAILTIADYHPIYAYGNSNGDQAMLTLADHQFYKRFNFQ